MVPFAADPGKALAARVAQEAERYRLTLEAMTDVDTGKGVSHQEVKAWAATLSTDTPGQLPD